MSAIVEKKIEAGLYSLDYLKTIAGKIGWSVVMGFAAYGFVVVLNDLLPTCPHSKCLTQPEKKSEKEKVQEEEEEEEETTLIQPVTSIDITPDEFPNLCRIAKQSNHTKETC